MGMFGVKVTVAVLGDETEKDKISAPKSIFDIDDCSLNTNDEESNFKDADKIKSKPCRVDFGTDVFHNGTARKNHLVTEPSAKITRVEQSLKERIKNKKKEKLVKTRNINNNSRKHEKETNKKPQNVPANLLVKRNTLVALKALKSKPEANNEAHDFKSNMDL